MSGFVTCRQHCPVSTHIVNTLAFLGERALLTDPPSRPQVATSLFAVASLLSSGRDAQGNVEATTWESVRVAFAISQGLAWYQIFINGFLPFRKVGVLSIIVLQARPRQSNSYAESGGCSCFRRAVAGRMPTT